jgi:hypothetical protein
MHLNEEQGRCKGEGPPQGGLNAMRRASCGVCWCVEQWVIKEGWGGLALICGTLGSLCCSGGTLCLRRRVRRCHARWLCEPHGAGLRAGMLQGWAVG